MPALRFLVLLLIATPLFAQRPNLQITGSVHDSTSGSPLEYATIILHSARDSSQLTGAAAGPQGAFTFDSLHPGRYFAKVNFLGYQTKIVQGIALNRETQRADLGKVLLSPTTLTAAEVTVTGERMQVEYHVEKKVINVAKQQVVPTGTATDVLAQSPGVTVDIEGNVKLRGSGNFTVMVDGRPSILDANDALQQIPAAAIDRIEIITNPSARFSAEGTSGIINIIQLHRSANVSGQVNVRSSIDERRSGEVTLSMPVGKTMLTLGGDAGVDHSPGESRAETRATFDGVTTTLQSDGASFRNRDRGGVRAELEVPLGARNTVAVGGRFGTHAFGGGSDLAYTRSDNQTNTTTYSFSDNNSEREHQFISGFANWRHKFPEEKHTLSADFNFGRRSGDESSSTEEFAQDATLIQGIRNTEEGPGGRSELKLDYVRPLGQERRVESGWSLQQGGFRNDYTQSSYDSVSGQYVAQPDFSNSSEFSRVLPAAYAMFANERGKFEYQLGVRGEYLDRTIERKSTNESFSLSRFDLFPTAHTAYDFGGGKQMLASYTRRVEHSRPWDLEPFITWEDAYSVRSGNPNLKPEFIDSYELGYQTSLLKQAVTAEAFYRVKHNNVERLQTVYAENVTLSQPANVGRQFSLGTELRADVTVRRGLTLSLTGSFFEQRVSGETAGRSFDEHDFSYDGKLNLIAALSPNTRFQLDGQYRGPSVTSQGTTEADAALNAALRQDFLNKRLNVSVQVRDVFASAKRESTNETPGLYSYNYFSMDAPVVTLSVGYAFNNFKKKRDANGTGEGSEDF